MTFSHSRYTLVSNYSINSIPLERVDRMRDLGILFDQKLTFNDHISFIVSKANSMLGYTKRNAKDCFP